MPVKNVRNGGDAPQAGRDVKLGKYTNHAKPCPLGKGSYCSLIRTIVNEAMGQ